MQVLIQKIRLSSFGIPLALLAACVLAFGLFIPWLGLYHDDLHFLYYASRGTQGLADIFNYDGHAQALWSYILTFKLFGYNPLLWHVFALFWRWLAMFVFWLCLKRLWPAYSRQTFTAALLFGLYPLFTLQVLPICFFEVWMSFSILALSFFLTLEAIRRPDKFWLFTSLAILVKIAHIFTKEYTWGTELMRPFLIWFMLPARLSWKEKLRQTLQIWLPYLLIFVAMVSWRVFFYQGERRAFQAQVGLLTNPLVTLVTLPRDLIPDMGLILFSSWYPAFNPRYLDLGERFNFLLMILILMSGIALFVFLRKISAANNETDDGENGNWPRQALIIGFSGLIFGLIPAYGSGYSIYLTEAPLNSRLALGAFPGAALIVTALLEIFLARRQAKLIVIATLFALLIGWHVRYTNDFRKIWIAQTSFYRQLSWRAPDLAANTGLIAEKSIFPSIDEFPATIAVEGDFPTALAINVIYDTNPQTTHQVPYWFFPSPNFPDTDGLKLTGEHVDAYFSGESKDSLFFSFSPQTGECLHIFRPEDAAYRGLPDESKALAASVSLDSIQVDGQTDFSVLDTIIGPEDTNTWCYFYEKADLARQKQDWATIPLLWEAATQRGLRSSGGREYLPFVEAYLRLNDWDRALELTRVAAKLTPNMGDVYCPLWREVAGETAPSEQKDTALNKAQNLLKCVAP